MASRSTARSKFRRRLLTTGAAAALALGGCRSVSPPAAAPSVAGDEIIVAGQRFHTGTRIVTWLEPAGHNAYAGAATFAPRAASLAELQAKTDWFVLHYDVCGVSRVCFDVLQARKLSVHFLLDVDGTVYQTLDLQERALHATVANDRSIGVELANIGAYPPDQAQPLAAWYQRAPDGRPQLTIPARIKAPGVLTPGFVGRPARPDLIAGTIQDRSLRQYDFTPQQYAALAKLTAALCRIFPQLRADYPHAWLSDAPLPAKLPDARLDRFHGVLGHYHLQENKVDPGPAFDWRRLRAAVRRELP